MIGFLIIGLIIFIYSYFVWKSEKKFIAVRGEEQKEEVLHNFPFKMGGKTYWYSRACAVTLMNFCKDKDGKLYVLANKRGKGCPDFNGYWNAPCGYLDFNETLKEAAIRETKEETGLNVPIEKVIPCGVDDSVTANHQNITHRFYSLLDGTIDEYKFDTSNMEEDEVDNVKWVSVDELNNYQWAFGHDNVIKEILEVINTL